MQFDELVSKVLKGCRLDLYAKMFNLYQSINKKEETESSVIGHDRFCRERLARSSIKRKKRRARSVAEFSQLDAAQKRSIFTSGRSRSSDQTGKASGVSSQKSGDSITKLFFPKR